MIGLVRRAVTGLAIVAVVMTASVGLVSNRALAQTPGNTVCVELFFPDPVNERGIVRYEEIAGMAQLNIVAPNSDDFRKVLENGDAFLRQLCHCRTGRRSWSCRS